MTSSARLFPPVPPPPHPAQLPCSPIFPSAHALTSQSGALHVREEQRVVCVQNRHVGCPAVAAVPKLQRVVTPVGKVAGGWGPPAARRVHASVWRGGAVWAGRRAAMLGHGRAAGAGCAAAPVAGSAANCWPGSALTQPVVAQRSTACRSTAPHSLPPRSTAQHVTARHSLEPYRQPLYAALLQAGGIQVDLPPPASAHCRGGARGVSGWVSCCAALCCAVLAALMQQHHGGPAGAGDTVSGIAKNGGGTCSGILFTVCGQGVFCTRCRSARAASAPGNGMPRSSWIQPCPTAATLRNEAHMGEASCIKLCPSPAPPPPPRQQALRRRHGGVSSAAGSSKQFCLPPPLLVLPSQLRCQKQRTSRHACQAPLFRPPCRRGWGGEDPGRHHSLARHPHLVLVHRPLAAAVRHVVAVHPAFAIGVASKGVGLWRL